MNTRLTQLLWGLCLIVLMVLILDERDELAKLDAQLQQAGVVQPRRLTQADMVSIGQSLDQAQRVEKLWNQRLVEVQRVGAFRAQGMERAVAMCRDLELVCQVAAVGEGPSTVGEVNSGSQNSSVSPGAPVDAVNLIVTGVKLSFPLDAFKVPLMLRSIERGEHLALVESMVVRSARVELLIRFYGVLNQSDQMQPVDGSLKPVARSGL